MDSEQNSTGRVQATGDVGPRLRHRKCYLDAEGNTSDLPVHGPKCDLWLISFTRDGIIDPSMLCSALTRLAKDTIVITARWRKF